MRIVFDMDNTLTDELGSTVRPGISDLLNKLVNDDHELILWTNSMGQRAYKILKDHDLRKYFAKLVFREDYDPDNKGLCKDIRFVDGDCLIDDSPKEIDFCKSNKLKYFHIKPYRKNMSLDEDELNNLYKYIKSISGFLGKFK